MLKRGIVTTAAVLALFACGESRDPALEWVGSYTLNGTTTVTCTDSTGSGTETNPVADTLTITAVTAGEVNFIIDDDPCAPFPATVKGDSVTVQPKTCPAGAMRQGFSAQTTSGEFRRDSAGEDLEGNVVVKSFIGSYSYKWSYSGDASVGPFNCTATDTLAGTRI